MDTWVIEGQKREQRCWLARVYVRHHEPWWCCAMLCVLVCGCNRLKPASARQTAKPPDVTSVVPNSNQAASPPPAPGTITAVAADPTPQPLQARTAIRDPSAAPAITAVPRPHPAKKNQNLRPPDVAAKVQSHYSVTNSLSNIAAPKTTVTYMPREAAAAMVIKGPPRRLEPPRIRSAVPLCLGIGVGAGLVALVISIQRRFRTPYVGKARKEELFLPSEFKLRDSAIQPDTPFGMLAPEKPVSRSKVALLVSALASSITPIGFVVSKLPFERISTACRAVRQRISAPVPAIPEQCSSTPLSSAAADFKSGEIDATVASPQNGVQGKPAESLPSSPSPNPGVPASPPVGTPTLDQPLTKSELTALGS